MDNDKDDISLIEPSFVFRFIWIRDSPNLIQNMRASWQTPPTLVSYENVSSILNLQFHKLICLKQWCKSTVNVKLQCALFHIYIQSHSFYLFICIDRQHQPKALEERFSAGKEKREGSWLCYSASKEVTFWTSFVRCLWQKWQSSKTYYGMSQIQ